jgi:hypothetical protein
MEISYFSIPKMGITDLEKGFSTDYIRKSTAAIVKYGFYSFVLNQDELNEKRIYVTSHDQGQGLIPKISHGIHFFMRETWLHEFINI